MPEVGAGTQGAERELVIRAASRWAVLDDPAQLRDLVGCVDGDLGRLLAALAPELDRRPPDPLGAVDRLQEAGQTQLARLLGELVAEVTKRKGDLVSTLLPGRYVVRVVFIGERKKGKGRKFPLKMRVLIPQSYAGEIIEDTLYSSEAAIARTIHVLRVAGVEVSEARAETSDLQGRLLAVDVEEQDYNGVKQLRPTYRGYSAPTEIERSLAEAMEAALPEDAPIKLAGPRSAGAGEEADPPHDAARIGEDIAEREFFARDHGGALYVFKDGVYRPGAEDFLRDQVKRWFIAEGIPEKWTRKKGEEVIGWLTAEASYLWPEPPMNPLNVANGLLDWKTGELKPHDPSHLSAVQIPVIFDPGASCPRWEKFVAEVFPEDSRALAWELPALLLVPFRIQKAIMLLGEGGNGKSTYLRGLVSFIGLRNVSAQSLQRLEVDRFAVASLVGKLANVCSDLPSEHLQGTSIFKGITGGDVLTAERKFQRSFEFSPFARLVFSANRPPRTNDPTSAFFDRWLVVRFERTFRGTREEIPAHVLDGQLAEAAELSGLLNMALALLPGVLVGGLTVGESMTRAAADFREVTDPVLVWIEANVIESPLAVIAKRDLKAAYNGAALAEGRPGENDTSFTKALRRWRPDLRDGQRTWNGRPRVPCWLGLGLQAAVDGSIPSKGSRGLPHLYRTEVQDMDVLYALGESGGKMGRPFDGFYAPDSPSNGVAAPAAPGDDA